MIAPLVEPGQWYQQDGAPPHNSHDVAGVLYETFEDRWFGNNGPHRWPPRSPDLTPLDFYFWGRIKDLVHSTPITTKEDCIQRVLNAINSLDRSEIRKSTHEGVENRINKCLEVQGRNFEHLK